MDGEQGLSAEQMTAAVMAGFDEDEHAQPTETPAAESAPAEPQPTAAPAPKFAQITEDDWNAQRSSAAKIDEIVATLDKRFEQFQGRVGRTFEEKINAFQKATPAGAAVQISDEDFQELKEQYPDIAEYTLKGFNKVVGKLRGSGIDEKRLDERLNAVRGEMVETSLAALFPTWREDVRDPEVGGKPDFRNWINAQPEDIQALQNSSHIGDAARMLRMYYERTQSPPAQAPAAAAAPVASKPAAPTLRQRQLAAAAVPKGDSAAPPAGGKSPFLSAFEDED